MVPNVCPGKEYKRRRIFISERELSLSEVVGKKDKMSNRAERLSGRAKRGQTAERSQTVLLTGDRGKGKFSRGKKKRLRLYFPSPGTHHWHHGGYIFFLIWSLFNHKSIASIHFGHLFHAYFILFCLFYTFTFTRALLLESIIYIHAYFIIENFACKIFNYKSM